MTKPLIRSLREADEQLKESLSSRSLPRTKSLSNTAAKGHHESFLREIQAQIELIDSELRPNSREISVTNIGTGEGQRETEEMTEDTGSNRENEVNTLKRRLADAQKTVKSLERQLKQGKTTETESSERGSVSFSEGRMGKQRELVLLK